MLELEELEVQVVLEELEVIRMVLMQLLETLIQVQVAVAEE